MVSSSEAGPPASTRQHPPAPAAPRIDADLTLPNSQAETHPGFVDALLDILQAEQDRNVRLASQSPVPSRNLPA